MGLLQRLKNFPKANGTRRSRSHACQLILFWSQQEIITARASQSDKDTQGLQDLKNQEGTLNPKPCCRFSDPSVVELSPKPSNPKKDRQVTLLETPLGPSGPLVSPPFLKAPPRERWALRNLEFRP